MRLKNAFRVLFANVNVLYKSVLCRAVITAIVALIAYFGIRPGLAPILGSPEAEKLLETVSKLFSDFFSGKGIDAAAATLPADFSGFTKMLAANAGGVKWTAIGAGLVWYIWNTLLLASDYAFGKAFDNHMSAYVHFPIIPTFLECAGKAFAYGSVMALINFAWGAVVLAIGVFAAVYLIPYVSVFSILLGILIIVLGFSYRATLFSSVMPSMINGGLGIGKALATCAPARKQTGELLGNYAFLIMACFYLNVSVAVFTFLSGLFVTLPFTALCFNCVAFVDYYVRKGKKFYVAYDTVVAPDGDRADAEYLKYM